MKLLAPAPLTGIYSLTLVLTKNTRFSLPPAGAAQRFVSGPLFCPTSPDGLGSCTGTPDFEVSRRADRLHAGVVQRRMPGRGPAARRERHVHQDKVSTGVTSTPAWKPASLGGCIAYRSGMESSNAAIDTARPGTNTDACEPVCANRGVSTKPAAACARA